MRKKIIILLFVVLNLFQNISFAQTRFFRGIGAFVAVNSSMNRYRNLNPKTIYRNEPDFVNAQNMYYPENHYSRDMQNFGVGILLEFLRYDKLRWQTELEYTRKSVLERDYDWFNDTRGPLTPNMYTQIQWNNYLKYFIYEGNKGAPYVMLGVRLEYNLAYSITAYAPVAAARPKIWFSGDAAVGYEFFTWKKWHPFVEFHWNPDVIYQPPVAGTSMRNRTYELRLGIIYRPAKARIDDCNAPKYHGNYY